MYEVKTLSGKLLGYFDNIGFARKELRTNEEINLFVEFLLMECDIDYDNFKSIIETLYSVCINRVPNYVE